MPSMIVTEGESQNPLSEAARVALAAKVAMSEEDLCPVCRGPLPDEGRGVIQCVSASGRSQDGRRDRRCISDYHVMFTGHSPHATS